MKFLQPALKMTCNFQENCETFSTTSSNKRDQRLFSKSEAISDIVSCCTVLSSRILKGCCCSLGFGVEGAKLGTVKELHVEQHGSANFGQ
jgi:hypothetical protein